MHVVHVNTATSPGGAAAVARELHLRMRNLPDIKSTLITHRNAGTIPDNPYLQVARRNFGRAVAKFRERFLGHQFVYYPHSFKLRELLSSPPDIYHMHNLHSWYFDLAAVPYLAKQAPVILMLHDEWLYTGHCASTIGCGRWQTGCGNCPDLNRNPMIHADGTVFNWQRKRRLLTPDLPIYITAPSKWLFERAASTYLGQFPMRLIYNGIDLSVFHPLNNHMVNANAKMESRQKLNLPPDKPLILFAAGRPDNLEKDFYSLIKGLQLLNQRCSPDERPWLVALGGAVDASLENLITPGFIQNTDELADYYRAVDVVVHATRADNCPLAVLEAMACGIPVVASDVGGVPELVEDRISGLIVPPQNPAALADAVKSLLKNPERAHQMGQAARARAEKYFDINHQVQESLTFYREILEGKI